MLISEEQRRQQQVKQGSGSAMQGLRRGGLGGDRPERDWGDGIRRRGRIWSERQCRRRSLDAADEEPLRRRLCYRGDSGSPVRGGDRKEGTERRYGDLLVADVARGEPGGGDPIRRQGAPAG